MYLACPLKSSDVLRIADAWLAWVGRIDCPSLTRNGWNG